LSDTLSNASRNLLNINLLYVLCCNEQTIDDLKQKYPEVLFNYVDLNNVTEPLKKILGQCTSNYIILSDDRCRLERVIDINICIHMLKKSWTYICYLALGYENNHDQFLNSDLPLFDRAHGVYAWYPTNRKKHCLKIPVTKMALWQKAVIEKLIIEQQVISANDLTSVLSNYLETSKMLGIFFSSSIVNVNDA